MAPRRRPAGTAAPVARIRPGAAGASPVIHRQAVPARVLVVMPGPRRHAGAYFAEARRRLRLSAGAPVAVHLLAVPDWSQVTARTVALVHSWRPLAVLVGPPGVRRSDAGADAAAALRDLATLAARGAAAGGVQQLAASGCREHRRIFGHSLARAGVTASPAPGVQTARLLPAPKARPRAAATTSPASPWPPATVAIRQALVAAALPVSPLERGDPATRDDQRRRDGAHEGRGRRQRRHPGACLLAGRARPAARLDAPRLLVRGAPADQGRHRRARGRGGAHGRASARVGLPDVDACGWRLAPGACRDVRVLPQRPARGRPGARRRPRAEARRGDRRRLRPGRRDALPGE